MEETPKQSIQRNFVKLMQELPANPVIHILHEDGVLNAKNMEELKGIHFAPALREKLLHIISSQGPETFNAFCGAIGKVGRPHLSHLLSTPPFIKYKWIITTWHGEGAHRSTLTFKDDVLFDTPEECVKDAMEHRPPICCGFNVEVIKTTKYKWRVQLYQNDGNTPWKTYACKTTFDSERTCLDDVQSQDFDHCPHYLNTATPE